MFKSKWLNFSNTPSDPTARTDKRVPGGLLSPLAPTLRGLSVKITPKAKNDNNFSKPTERADKSRPERLLPSGENESDPSADVFSEDPTNATDGTDRRVPIDLTAKVPVTEKGVNRLLAVLTPTQAGVLEKNQLHSYLLHWLPHRDADLVELSVCHLDDADAGWLNKIVAAGTHFEPPGCYHLAAGIVLLGREGIKVDLERCRPTPPVSAEVIRIQQEIDRERKEALVRLRKAVNTGDAVALAATVKGYNRDHGPAPSWAVLPPQKCYE